jgi:hypothetical protein
VGLSDAVIDNNSVSETVLSTSGIPNQHHEAIGSVCHYEPSHSAIALTS